MTWELELDSYLDYHKAKGTGTSYRDGAKAYLTRLGERFNPGSFSMLSKAQLVKWVGELREKDLAEATLKTISGRVLAFFRWLNDGETPPTMRGLSVGRNGPRIQTKGDLLSEGEFSKLVKASRPRDQVVYLLLRWTGARPSEVLGLRGKDVTLTPQGDFELAFRETKSGGTRAVPLVNPEAVGALKDYLEIAPPGRDDALFPGRKGKPFQAASLWRAMHRTADRVGITRRVFPYMLRHQRGTELYHAPQGVRDRLMGWKSGVMWKNYEHLETDDLTAYLREEEGVGTTPEAVVQWISADLETLREAVVSTAPEGQIPTQLLERIDEILEKTIDIMDLDDAMRVGIGVVEDVIAATVKRAGKR